MVDLKTAFYASVGLALKGKEKVEQAARKFVKDNKLEAARGKEFVDKAVKYAEATKSELSKKIQETVKVTVSKMGFMTHKEADALKEEIKSLKAQLKKSRKSK
jgi:polyhydroxyalkanoate synthesis regulator phasin